MVCLAGWMAVFSLAGGAGAVISARDVTKARGIKAAETITYGSSWVDHDLDGDVDLFLNRHWMRPWFFIARGDRFERSAEDFVSLPGYEPPEEGSVDRHDCMWGEANGDGDPDLYCAMGAQQGKGSGPNQLVMRTDGGWVDRAEDFGVADPLGRGRCVNWVDYDGDADLDLFLGNGKRSGQPNELYRNTGDGFDPVGEALRDEMRSLTCSWADWDVDGDPDLLVTRGGITGDRVTKPVAYRNDQGRFVRVRIPGISRHSWTSVAWGGVDGNRRVDVALVRNKRVRVLRNLGGSFTAVFSARVTKGRSVVWLDWDNDTDLDLFVVQGATGEPGSRTNKPDLLFLRTEKGFRRVEKAPLKGPAAGNGETATVSDFDRDGRIDLFVTNGNNPSAWQGRSTLLRNTSTVGNWAGLDLHGGRWNPLAVGAIVQVRIGDTTYWRFPGDGAGYKSQSEIGYVHLGLGDAPSALATVYWSDGSTDCVVVRDGRIARVSKDGAPCDV